MGRQPTILLYAVMRIATLQQFHHSFVGREKRLRSVHRRSAGEGQTHRLFLMLRELKPPIHKRQALSNSCRLSGFGPIWDWTQDCLPHMCCAQRMIAGGELTNGHSPPLDTRRKDLREIVRSTQTVLLIPMGLPVCSQNGYG